MSLQDVMQRADVWRGGRAPAAFGIPTGFGELDPLFIGGWPQGALTEMLTAKPGVGELRLLLPALAALSRREQWLVFIAPPYIPYAPALARAGINLSRVLLIHPRDAREALWAAEQSLRAGTCSAVLLWSKAVDVKILRRLQLAAEAGESAGFVFRHERAAGESSPAALRLRLSPHAEGVEISILKRRGGWPTGPVTVGFDDVMAGASSARTAARDLHAWRRGR